jgi:hypothetical protein
MTNENGTEYIKSAHAVFWKIFKSVVPAFRGFFLASKTAGVSVKLLTDFL